MRFLFEGNENILGSGDDCTTFGLYYRPLNGLKGVFCDKLMKFQISTHNVLKGQSKKIMGNFFPLFPKNNF